MRRADRLFTIVHYLRGGRYVTARTLADRLECSERTIYRDVDELTLCGVPVEGEAGRGFRLPASFEIPPLMFDRGEIEALVVGARFVEAWCGPTLAASARSALARIRAAVPAALVDDLDEARVFAPRFERPAVRHFDVVHGAVVAKRRLVIGYRAADGVAQDRVVRPLGLYFWGKVWTLAAWCELRDDFRNFRIDRIATAIAGTPFDDEPGKTLDVLMARIRAAAAAR